MTNKFSTNLISIIFAAGRGTRLIPLTDTTPKPLLKVQNKPLIEWNMEQAVDKVDKFVIVISYLGEQIQKYFGGNYKGVPIEYVMQTNPKGGNLDALSIAIYNSSPDVLTKNYLIQHCDDIHGKQTFDNLFDKINQNPGQAYLSAKVIEDREKLKSFGVFRVNEQYKFLEIIEKPQEYISELANIAISYFPNKVINFVLKNIEYTGKEAFITDMFNEYSKHYPIEIVPTTALWIPITSISDLDLAQKYFVE